MFELAKWPQIYARTEPDQPGVIRIDPRAGQFLQFIGNSISGGRRGLKALEAQNRHWDGQYAPYDTRFLEYDPPATMESALGWPDGSQGGPTRISVSGLTCFGPDETVDSVFAEFLDNTTDNKAKSAQVMATGDPATDWNDSVFAPGPPPNPYNVGGNWIKTHAPGMTSNNVPCLGSSPLKPPCQGGNPACPIGGLCPNVPGLP